MRALSKPSPIVGRHAAQIRGSASADGMHLSIAMVTLALSANAAWANAAPPAKPKPIDEYASTVSFSARDAAWPSDRWWEGYSDPQLSALIDEALAGAPDLRIAEARIKKADAIARESGAALLPTVDGSGSVGEERQSYNLGVPVPRGWNSQGQAALNFNWEIDFWGKNRAALAAATSQAQAARAEGAAARLALSASIAEAYADLSQLFADQDAARDALDVRTETAKLIRGRFAKGLENNGAAERAESARATAEADMARIDESIDLNRNRIAALIGAGPDRGLAIAPPTASVPKTFGLPSNLPAELIGRRPDVIAARLQAEAAAKRIKVAKAAFYPNINLSAMIGLQTIGLSKFFQSGSDMGSVGPAISLPIFEGGRLRAQFHGAQADYAMAVAEYDGAVAQALQDVADAAVSSKALLIRLSKTEEAETAATSAWRVTNNRYRGGLATYLEVLTAEDAMIAARRSTADLKSRAFTLDVAMVKALGGGFRASSSHS